MEAEVGVKLTKVKEHQELPTTPEARKRQGSILP